MNWDSDPEHSNLEPNYGRRMSHAEAVMLCRYAKAACPQQAFDQYTPDAWSDLLGDLRFADCQEALKAVVQRQPFVSPAEIRAEVKRVRYKRIGEFGPIPVPDELPDAEYSRYMSETMRAIGDGELSRGDVPPLLASLSKPLQVQAGRTVGDVLRHDDPTAARVAVLRQQSREAVAATKAVPEPKPAPVYACEAAVTEDGGIVICEAPATGTAQ